MACLLNSTLFMSILPYTINMATYQAGDKIAGTTTKPLNGPKSQKCNTLNILALDIMHKLPLYCHYNDCSVGLGALFGRLNIA